MAAPTIEKKFMRTEKSFSNVAHFVQWKILDYLNGRIDTDQSPGHRTFGSFAYVQDCEGEGKIVTADLMRGIGHGACKVVVDVRDISPRIYAERVTEDQTEYFAMDAQGLLETTASPDRQASLPFLTVAHALLVAGHKTKH